MRLSWQEWLLIGLAAWCVLSVVTALLVGPVLRRRSEVMEAIDQDFYAKYGEGVAPLQADPVT